MRRICVIGDSQAGAVKMGMDLLRSQGAISNVSVDIFASPRQSLAKCQIANGMMTPLTEYVKSNFQRYSGGKGEIILDNYDDVFLIADVSPYLLSEYVEEGVISPTSRAVIREVIHGWSGRWAYMMADAMARASAVARVHFVGHPFPSDGSPLARRIISAQASDASAVVGHIAAIKTKITEELAKLQSPIATFFHPPPICLEQFGLFTKDQYCRDSVRLDLSEKHPDGDFVHMNALYGRQLIRLLLSDDESGDDSGLAPAAPHLPTG